MADLIIAGTTYSGNPNNTSNPFRPIHYSRKRIKVGRLFTAKDGTTIWLHRGFKWVFEIGWEKANATTAAAVLARRNATASFAFVDYDGTSYTVVTVGDDDYQEDITTSMANAYRFDLTLTLRQV